MLLRCLVSLLLSCLGSGISWAEAPVDACNEPVLATVLRPSASQAVARAVWLDGGRLQWPGVQLAAGERLQLLHSADGTLVAAPGEPATGFDAAFTLEDTSASAADAPFAYLAAGVRAAVKADDRARLHAMLPGQWLLARIDAAGRMLGATSLQWPAWLDETFAPAQSLADLGVTVRRGRSTRFVLWAPTARAVSVCVYPHGEGPAESADALRRDAVTGAWSLELPRDRSGGYYTYLVEVFVPGAGWVRNRVTDPYALSLTTDSSRAYIADLADPRLKPPGWDAHDAPAAFQANTDMVIYELHVRDFSVGDASVPLAHRGKYLAFTDTASRGMRHLRALARAGLTDVHLLPVFDIASIPETGCVTPRVPTAAPDSPEQQAAVMATAQRDCFNWGYDPFHYSAPEGSYASNAADGATRIRELRAMVMALHRAGLRVGMDVVYNHTAASGQQAKSVLDRIVPGYYHRLDGEGRVERSTCCDNTATEHAMMGKLMIDSVRSWATQYRIDSFRFDLMAHQPRAAMQALQREVDAAIGGHVNLIGEGWNFGEVADGRRFVQASQRSLAGSGIGTFSDRARDAVRGGSAGDEGAALVERKGWINGGAEGPREEAMRLADLVRVGLAGTLRDYEMQTRGGDTRPLAKIDYAGQPAGYAAEPGEVVNYVENHDNQTLFDNNALKLPRDLPPHERARVQVLAAAINLFSQGVAYFHAGLDTLRSKSLDRNSFDSGDWFNRLDWSYRSNHFGTGLPPAGDNERSWPQFQPLLAQARVAPRPQDIAWTRDAFRDLLAIRASTPLFRLRTAASVRERLRFLGTGPQQNPALIAAELDGRGLADARFDRLVYFLNATGTAQQFAWPDEAGAAWQLHPVHRRRGAADRRVAREARFDAAAGVFTLPARSAVVFVQPAR